MTAVAYEVDYQIATYAGTVVVCADENAERDHIIALACAYLSRTGLRLPFGSRAFKVRRASA